MFDGSSFVKVQSIVSDTIMDMASFVVDGQVHLAVAAYSGSFSQIYKWDGTSFKKDQEIPTNAAYGVHSFAVDKEQFLAIANSENGHTTKIDSKIYKCDVIPNNSELTVTPVNRDVLKNFGTTSFNIFNTGTGTMLWTASVTSGNDWLTITSGNSGSSTGTITCSYTANTGTTSRTATIRVMATGAGGSPADVTVIQSADISACTATIDGNLQLHIPLLSHLIPYWGAPSYTVDLVYAYNPSYPTMIIFKLTQAALAQSGVYLCDPSTLADDFTIHILDALRPDGITRMWLDLTYSQALSTNGVCFYVSNYGVISK